MARRTSLTEKVIKDLEKHIMQTTSIRIACGCAGVPVSTYFFWIKQAQEIADGEEDESLLTKEDLLLLELLDRTEIAKAKSCKPAIDTVMKAIKDGDANQAARLLSRRMPEEFGDWNRKEVTIRQETTEESSTGIALIPSMGSDNDLDQLLQQQQSEALLLAKTKTSELS
ncbi:hypothetical protein J5H75_27320 [Pseudomonas asiatica]|uniref:hypothetical protein n=1 Tax=Pseudomonas asiatica TaxID=2219225 RepID=UPI001AAF2C96|nr:hypothetical protein [Pseudomonas asiatica]MBO2925383.1 hypothetical protein [Pseudomonas asiatica]